jgi:hypothetical protein
MFNKELSIKKTNTINSYITIILFLSKKSILSAGIFLEEIKRFQERSCFCE